MVDSVFKILRNPQKDHIQKVLLDEFGDIKQILLDLQSSHQKYGSLPEDYRSNVKENFSKIEGHCNLIETANIVFLHCNTPDTHIMEYNDKVTSYLPMFFQMKLHKNDGDNIKENFSNTIEVYRNLKKYIRNYLQYHIVETKTQFEKQLALTFVNESNRPYVYEDTHKCPICKFMKKELKIETQNKKHLLTGRSVVLESCPNLLNLSTIQKSNFLKSINFCRRCGYKKISSKHLESLCHFTKDHVGTKCLEQGCYNRATFCSEHKSKNKKKLKFTTALLRANKVEGYKF